MNANALAEVEAPVNYIVPNGKKAYAYEYDPPAGTPRRSSEYREQRVRIRNARNLHPSPALDRQGFELRPHPTRVKDFYDPAEVLEVYYPELESLVKEATGASSVVVFDHTVRGEAVANRSGVTIQEPVSRVHNDYTVASALRRVRDVVPRGRVEELLQHRIVELNVWRPIRGPVQSKPLAVLDASTVQLDDFVACELIYRDRRGEIYYVAHRPRHAWYYFPDMRRDEALLLKGFDSDASRARFAAHAAFTNPHAPADALPRESIEARTFAFFAPNTVARPSQFMVQWR